MLARIQDVSTHQVFPELPLSVHTLAVLHP